MLKRKPMVNEILQNSRGDRVRVVALLGDREELCKYVSLHGGEPNYFTWGIGDKLNENWSHTTPES